MKCEACPVPSGLNCVGRGFCPAMAANPDRWRAAIVSHAEQRRAKKKAVPLGTPHCVPCQQTKK